jgi:hypothetical protein
MITKRLLLAHKDNRLQIFLKDGRYYTGQVLGFSEDDELVQFFDKFGITHFISLESIVRFLIIKWPGEKNK